MRPVGPSTSSSTKFAAPSQIGRTSDVPRYSAHLVDPLSGLTRRESSVVHEPSSKSKSCCPSRSGAALVMPSRLPLPADALVEAVEDQVETELELVAVVVPRLHDVVGEHLGEVRIGPGCERPEHGL